MKRLLSIILIIFCCETLYSQQITLDFCVGTWEYKNPATGEEFMMTLKRSTYNVPKGFGGGIKDCLVGGYIHTKNGIVLINCMDQLNENKKATDYSILIFHFGAKDYLDLTVEDFNIKNGYNIPKVIGMPSKITLYSTSPRQIKMEIIPDEQEKVYLDNREVFARGTTLPREMILTKVE